MIRLSLQQWFFYGFYSLIGRVFDCDSKCVGSTPIKNPKRRWLSG